MIIAVLQWLCAMYAILVLALAWKCYHLIRKDAISTPRAQKELLSFSIIIPYRNEEVRLRPLLSSLAHLNYPSDRYEIIFVDDQSEDNSSQLIEEFQSRNQRLTIKNRRSIRRSGAPKKDALQTGIEQSSMDWIITTDADCVVPADWLYGVNKSRTQESTQMVCGPVSLTSANTAAGIFDKVDFMAQQACSLGAYGYDIPLGCSGANLAFAKAKFIKLQGYSDNDHIASGDDVFLMHKFFKDNPRQVIFDVRTDTLVTTPATLSWEAIFQQRKRWGAKVSAYRNFPSRALIGLLLLTNVLVLLITLSLPIFPEFLQTALACWLLKLVVDIILVRVVSRIYQQKNEIYHLLWVGLIYPFFTVFVLLSTLFFKFNWKGRSFSK